MGKERGPTPDPAKLDKDLTFRERMAFRILWLMFTMVYPGQFKHEFDNLWTFVTKGEEDE